MCSLTMATVWACLTARADLRNNDAKTWHGTRESMLPGNTKNVNE